MAMCDQCKSVQSVINNAQSMMRDEMALGKVMDGLMGPRTVQAIRGDDSTPGRYAAQQRRARELALDIIDEHQLVLSLGQWQVVQNMMEQAIMTGVQLEQDL